MNEDLSNFGIYALLKSTENKDLSMALIYANRTFPPNEKTICYILISKDQDNKEHINYDDLLSKEPYMLHKRVCSK